MEPGNEEEEMDWDYFYHPEDIPGHDEMPDEEDIWNQIMEEEFGNEL